MSDNLKPCPFCGGDATLSIGKYGNGAPWPYIECEQCAASTEPHIWNTRADLHDDTKAQLAECEARLRKAVEALKSLIQHAYNCEKELTEELHHMDFCGESLLLINARAVLAEIEKGGV